MRVLVVGSGGREHALAWRLAQSPSVDEIFAAPGNSGAAGLGTNLPIPDTNLDGIVAAATDHAIDLVVVGPETPLALGLSDRLNAAGIPAFGPGRAAAQLESSKSFARAVMDSAGVPGPNYRIFQSVAGALNYVQFHDAPVVVKADGLAAGKGVAMCANREDAQYAIRACMGERAFGDAGNTVVIEDWLHGPEVSVFGFTDGENLSPVVAATDYKRIGEGGAGPNTAAMGSYGPPDFWNDYLAETIREDFMLPVIRELDRRGARYRGRPVLRFDAHRRRAASLGIQLPIWRPGNPGSHATTAQRPGRGHAGLRYRQSGRYRPRALVKPAGRSGCDGVRWIPRRLPDGLPHCRVRRRWRHQ